MLDMNEPQWYILQTSYGCEAVVEREIRELIASEQYKDTILDVAVPREEIIRETPTGKKRRVEKPKFPNYAFVKMIYSKQTWWAVKSSRGVVKFCGDANNKPIPMPPDEVKRAKLEAVNVEDLKINIGDNVIIISGPFKDWDGEVIEIKPEEQKIRVNVKFYNRLTPMDLDFNQVEKI